VVNASIKAHRLVLYALAGPPPQKKWREYEAVHACLTKGCLNPHHLYWSTRRVNAAGINRTSWWRSHMLLRLLRQRHRFRQQGPEESSLPPETLERRRHQLQVEQQRRRQHNARLLDEARQRNADLFNGWLTGLVEWGKLQAANLQTPGPPEVTESLDRMHQQIQQGLTYARNQGRYLDDMSVQMAALLPQPPPPPPPPPQQQQQPQQQEGAAPPPPL
jgi:hypothetical protein